MTKINASLTFTRDGIATVMVMKDISYGKLVATELALATAQLQLCGWGVSKLAGLLTPATKTATESDVEVRFDADFEGGGSAEFSAAWGGLSQTDADAVQTIFEKALAT